jgi:hypothetical protein
MFQIKFVEKMKTFLFGDFFPEDLVVYDITVEKYCTT